MIPQFDLIETLVQKFKIPSFRQRGIEADDLIATLTRKWLAASPKHSVVIVTGDKDLMQLVGERVRVWDTMNQKTYSPIEVEEKFGVKPDQIRDFLAMVGDSSDNIPGIPSIGPKSAVDLLKFGNNAANDTYTKLCKDAGLNVHPARFPAALPEFFLKLLTDAGDLVVDPFAGSNTTGAVAEALVPCHSLIFG